MILLALCIERSKIFFKTKQEYLSVRRKLNLPLCVCGSASLSLFARFLSTKASLPCGVSSLTLCVHLSPSLPARD
jgi:hypothetical protein